MAEQQSSKGEQGKGVPSGGEQKTAETTAHDPRLLPGGSPDAAKTSVGMPGLDKDAMWSDDAEVPGVKSTS
jgi:hypothetical protein